MIAYRVEVAPEALAHATAINAWRREHRPTSPVLFREEFADALALLARTPHAGRAFEPARESAGSTTSADVNPARA